MAKVLLRIEITKLNQMDSDRINYLGMVVNFFLELILFMMSFNDYYHPGKHQ
jgi:hypothetical protein